MHTSVQNQNRSDKISELIEVKLFRTFHSKEGELYINKQPFRISFFAENPVLKIKFLVEEFLFFAKNLSVCNKSNHCTDIVLD